MPDTFPLESFSLWALCDVLCLVLVCHLAKRPSDGQALGMASAKTFVPLHS